MDLYASAALTGMGYALSQQRDTLKVNARMNAQQQVDPREQPSMQNMYNSDNYYNVAADERMRGTQMWNASQNPMETGVVPKPAYASMFEAVNMENAYESQKQQRVESLSGMAMRPEEFTHANMQPFFAGKVTQNTGDSAYATKLGSYTGQDNSVYRHKKEVECFFEPTDGFANVCGFMENKNDFYMNRVVAPKNRNNDFPIAQVHVGKGLGQGYTDTPAGGFQQADTLDFVRPKTVDELRVATNPKITYNVPTPATKVGTFQRGIIPKVSKNRPDICYEQTADQLFRTTGAYKKSTLRPVEEVKATSRVDTHQEYSGSAQSSTTHPGLGSSDDYGKDSIMVFNNSRELTGSTSIVTNLTSSVKAIVAPLLDIFRHNTKEYTIDAAREFGNMHAQIPEKATTYDPVNHIMKTTIKETTIHDTTINNLTGKTRGPMAALDETKTTIRQTTPVEDVVRNVAAHKYNVTMYNVDEVARTTVRQTTSLIGSMYGYIGGKAQDIGTGAYSVIDVEMPNTQKQFTSDYEYEGIAGSKADFRPTSDEAERNAEIDATRDAILAAAGHTPNGAGGFTGRDPGTFDMESKKLLSDSIIERETGNSRPIQVTARAIDACEVTKPAELLNANVNRLDSGMLASLQSNPYSIRINPVVDCDPK